MEAKKILLADDSANDVELTLSALDEPNLASEVVVVRDGAQALDYLYHRGPFTDRPPGQPGLVHRRGEEAQPVLGAGQSGPPR